MNSEELIQMAIAVRDRAYAPYSRFAVGAALLARSGRVYTGCNVENLSFGLTLCAERSAVVAAVAAGDREFEAIAIVSDSQVPVSPCGACRQVLAEFAPRLGVHCANLAGQRYSVTLDEIFPRPSEGILG